MSAELIEARKELSLPEWFDVWKSSLWIKCVSHMVKVVTRPTCKDFNFVYLRSTVSSFDVIYKDPIEKIMVCAYDGEDYNLAKEAFLSYVYHIGSDTKYIESLMMIEREVNCWRREKFCNFCSYKGADIQMNLLGTIRVYDHSTGNIAYLGSGFCDAREIFCKL